MKRASLLGFLAVSVALFLMGIAGAIAFHKLPYRISWRNYEIILQVVAVAKPVYLLLFIAAVIVAVSRLRDSSPKLTALSFLNVVAVVVLFVLAGITRPISTVGPVNQCINNQRLINSWILFNGPELTNEIWRLITAPCRSGGKYSVSSSGVQCSIADHNFLDDTLPPSSNAFLHWIYQYDQNADGMLSQYELDLSSTNWRALPK